MYKVKYEDNTGNGDNIEEYKTVEEAEAAIEYDLKGVKEFFGIECYDYDYGDFGNDYGNLTTEIWAVDGDEYARWIRMWERVRKGTGDENGRI